MIPIARPLLGPEEEEAVLGVLQSGLLTQGPQVAAFEEAFAAHLGARYAVAASSGTTALHLALLAHGLGPGDEVVVPSFTFIAPVAAVLYVGARPVFADIDPATFTVDPVSVAANLTRRSKAILVVHLYGLPADLAPLAALAQDRGLALIEDACQAHGARYQGRAVGTFGTAAFSFYPSKNMTTGEGGMVTTNSAKVAQDCRILRSHGMKSRYVHEVLGYNYRLTEVAAAIGLCQLKRLDEWNQARRANAARLTAGLRGLEGWGVRAPVVPPGREHVFHQYTIRVRPGDRADLQAHLAARGIETRVYYPVPAHRQPMLAPGRPAPGSGARLPADRAQPDALVPADHRQMLPETALAASEVLSLPVHPGLTPEETDLIAAAVRDFYARAGSAGGGVPPGDRRARWPSAAPPAGRGRGGT